MLKLRPEYKTLICDLAAKTFSTPLEIWAHGSRVDGSAHSGSDLDMVIVENQPLDLEEYFAFKEALQESNLPILTDVLIWNKIPPGFQANILKRYEVLYVHSPATA